MPAVLAVDLGKSGCRAALWLAPERDPAGKPARSADGPGARAVLRGTGPSWWQDFAPDVS